MRTLETPPAAVFDRDVATGSFAGALPRIDWTTALGAEGRGRLFRALHDKRWIYVGVRDGSLFVGAAVVRTGYASNALVWAWDASEPGLLDERVAIGSFTSAAVSDDGPGARRASFHAGGLRIVIDDHAVAIDAPRGASIGPSERSASSRRTDPFHVRLDVTDAVAPPIGAICRIPGGLASATQKHLATASGEIVVGNRRRLVSSAQVAFDYTNGLLARHTSWRWALALGATKDGTRVGLNLVQGFVGEAECALWVGDRIEPVGEGIFDLDVDDPMRPWTVKTTCGAVDLVFHPSAMHNQKRDMVLVKSRFLQPAGRFTGTIRSVTGLGGVALEGLDLLGVAEDQDLIW
jgi:hypothetical protein